MIAFIGNVHILLNYLSKDRSTRIACSACPEAATYSSAGSAAGPLVAAGGTARSHRPFAATWSSCACRAAVVGA